MKNFRPQIGLQNSVCAFVDPMHSPHLSHTLRRTGEGVDMPVQDGAPSKEQFFALLDYYGVDFLMQHVMPGEEEHIAFIKEMLRHQELGFMMANEFSNINLDFVPGTNRGDFSETVAQFARTHPKFLGFLFDETEHLQLHPNVYRRDPNATTRWQWADPTGKTLDEIEDSVTFAVAQDRRRLGSPIYSEHVFPVMYHAFARGGMNPMPKVLKEEYQSVQLASALGAAIQYQTDFGVCVDMWGPDAGPWFSRKWGFPGHSPKEIESGLRLAWHYAPSKMFLENIDPLARFTEKEGFTQTLFGDIFHQFVHDYVPNHPLPYRFDQAFADIAFVRADDALFRKEGTFNGDGMYGSEELSVDSHHISVFKAWSMLSHKTVPEDQIYYCGARYQSSRAHVPVNDETIGTLPLENGIPVYPGDAVHGLFYPMNGVLAFDERVTYRDLAPTSLLVAAGSRMTAATANAMLRRVSEGATMVAAPWLMPNDCRKSKTTGSGKLIISETFAEEDMLDQIKGYLGTKDKWTQRFGDKRLAITNPNGDNISLEFAVEEVNR